MYLRKEKRMREMLVRFLDSYGKEEVSTHEEAHLQQALAEFLREELGPAWNVEECPRKKDGKAQVMVMKKGASEVGLEVRKPLGYNGRAPEYMYDFIKDIAYLEELKGNGLPKAYCLMIVDDDRYYRVAKRRKGDGIYAYFRAKAPIHGKIEKPTGGTKEAVFIDGEYRIDWRMMRNSEKGRYCFIEVAPVAGKIQESKAS